MTTAVTGCKFCDIVNYKKDLHLKSSEKILQLGFIPQNKLKNQDDRKEIRLKNYILLGSSKLSIIVPTLMNICHSLFFILSLFFMKMLNIFEPRKAITRFTP
uniref:Ovule protein n=1 Tax=Heterorhabditis bacteriophora TaxID=37862 RepID=A0A1I7WYT1_HETBA